MLMTVPDFLNLASESRERAYFFTLGPSQVGVFLQVPPFGYVESKSGIIFAVRCSHSQ